MQVGHCFCFQIHWPLQYVLLFRSVDWHSNLTENEELRACSLFCCQNNIASRWIMTYIYESTCQSVLLPYLPILEGLLGLTWRQCLSWSLVAPNRSLLGCSTEGVGGREANIFAFLYLEMFHLMWRQNYPAKPKPSGILFVSISVVVLNWKIAATAWSFYY